MQQRVFVAGATGVLGRRVVTRLAAAGVAVTAVARRAEERAELASRGIRPIELDLFDPAAVRAAVRGHDVVFNLATAIPVGERAGELAAWDVNDRIRREGSRHLVDAAIANDASRYVQESIAFLYADGDDRVLDESAPIEAVAITAGALEAEANTRRFADHGGVGVALRFGQFYGFDSGHTVQAIDAALAGAPVELGPKAAYRSAVTTDDAATAVVAALAAPSGVYNVVDDRPVPRSEHVAALAEALGVPVPSPPSVTPALPASFAVVLRSLRVSSRRFQEVTPWQPQFPSAWEGWAHVVAEWRAQRAEFGV